MIDDMGVIPTARGSYSIVRRIGGGTVHVVYEARKAGTAGFSRTFAIKALRPEFVADPQANEALRREACFLARADHPNIVLAHAFEEDQHGRFLVMEYVPGPDLGTLVNEALVGLSVGGTLFILSEILEALAFLHGLDPYPLVHRNLAIDNILLSPSGTVKLNDFGHATQTGRTSIRSDVIDVGALLERLLTGTPRRPGLKPKLPPALDELTHRARTSPAEGGFSGAAEFRAAVLRTLETVAPGYADRAFARELRRLSPTKFPEPSGAFVPPEKPRRRRSVPPPLPPPGIGRPGFLETRDVLIRDPDRTPPPPPIPNPPPRAAPKVPSSPAVRPLSFFLRAAGDPTLKGPLGPADVFDVLTHFARVNRPVDISTDRTNWLTVDAWLRLLGEHPVPPGSFAPDGHVSGDLESRSLFALCAQLVRAQATGRLTLIRQHQAVAERIEIHLQNGTLASAFSNARITESWHRLLGTGSKRDRTLCESIHRVCEERRRLNLDVNRAVPIQVARNRRTRLVIEDAARWTNGVFVFDGTASPVVYAKMPLMPTLVDGLRHGHPEEVLRSPGVSFRERRLVLADRHEAILSQLGLSVATHFGGIRFGDGLTWNQSIEDGLSSQSPRDALLLGYVLAQLGLLRLASAA